MSVTARLSPDTLEDLRRSGLSPTTVASSGIKDETTDDETAQRLDRYHVQGFVLPYFGLDRQQLKFYRIKVLASKNGTTPKYLQPKAAGNHLYLPPGLSTIDSKWAKNTDLPLFITEGEKKALAGVQAGLPTLAVGGVYSWRTHIHTMSRESVRAIEEKPSARIVHLDDRGEKAYKTQVASELEDIEWGNREVFLIFDSDATTNDEVQRAAFEFANWLDGRGAVTKQISLADRVPLATLKRIGQEANAKVGLDDALALHPPFGNDLDDPEWRSTNSFRPLPSDPLQWVDEQLNAGRTTRETQERVAAFAINWLDANGVRFMGVDHTYYFFDNETRVLHDFRPGTNLASLRETSFGHLLVEQLGLDPADNATVGRLIGLYPLGAEIISPSRVLALSDEYPDTIYYQLSDSDVMRIDADGLNLISNGDDGVLFYRGNVQEMDLDQLATDCDKWKRPKVPLWYGALASSNIEPMGTLDREQTLQLLTTLCYMSPYLQRWRGLMLPLEIAVAEAGSGKSFLYNLRKGVLTGYPSLSGLPDDYRSWVAAVGSAPGLWICDNLGNIKSEYWHRLNDELARLITDPEPTVEQRQLYTTATIFRTPIRAAFAITTIKNPFTAPDVLQRSILYNLSAIPEGERDGDWYTDKLAERTKWIAEHVNVVHEFLKLARTEWKQNYKSGYRLVHFEQAALLMGRALGWDLRKIIAALPSLVSAVIAQYDPIIEALSMFVDEWPHKRKRVRLQEVVDWSEADPGERFSALRQLGNEVLLVKYINSHKYDIEQALGIQVLREEGATLFILPGG